jgi:hypothetical protein
MFYPSDRVLVAIMNDRRDFEMGAVTLFFHVHS